LIKDPALDLVDLQCDTAGPESRGWCLRETLLETSWRLVHGDECYTKCGARIFWIY
jgi:hypothetical protein